MHVFICCLWCTHACTNDVLARLADTANFSRIHIYTLRYQPCMHINDFMCLFVSRQIMPSIQSILAEHSSPSIQSKLYRYMYVWYVVVDFVFLQHVQVALVRTNKRRCHLSISVICHPFGKHARRVKTAAVSTQRNLLERTIASGWAHQLVRKQGAFVPPLPSAKIFRPIRRTPLRK